MYNSEFLCTESRGTGLSVGVFVVALLTIALVGATTSTVAAQSTTPSPNADFNVTKGEDSFSIEIEDPGNLDTLQLSSPDGTRSTEAVGVVRRGTKLRVSDSPDLRTTIIDPTDPSNSVRAADILGDTLALGYTVDEKSFECVTLHEGYNFAGILISSSQNHPCHTPVLAHFDAQGVLDVDSSIDFGTFEDGKPVPITYQEGTYELVGTVGDKSAVVETVTVESDGDTASPVEDVSDELWTAVTGNDGDIGNLSLSDLGNAIQEYQKNPSDADVDGAPITLSDLGSLIQYYRTEVV